MVVRNDDDHVRILGFQLAPGVEGDKEKADWSDILAQLLVFTSETRESFGDWTIPALEKVMPHLGRYIHLKIFQEMPAPKREGTIEDFQQLAISVNSMFK